MIGHSLSPTGRQATPNHNGRDFSQNRFTWNDKDYFILENFKF